MVLSLEHVYLNRNGSWILQDINWEVKRGENWVLFGLNGAGKTALLNVLNAYDYPTMGKVRVLDKEFGKTMLGEHLRNKIGLVSSSLQEKLYRNDSPFEIVLSGAFSSIGLYEEPTCQMRQRAVVLLEQLGCLKYADRNYETLSQGEKQRVLIARALMANPELIILDEPTNGLDFVAREELLETIEQMGSATTGPTILYVTHHVEEIIPIFEKTLLLKEGKVFAAGKTDEMLSGEILSDFFNFPVELIWNNNRPLLTKMISFK